MRKVVLISETGYNREHDSLLSSFLDQKYELFCAVGKDCELWEEVMDELAVGNGESPRYITTTSHSNESVDEVIEFAKFFGNELGEEVHVVRI